MKAKIDYSIYLVTDEVALKGRELLPVVEKALQNGVTLVQYRNKNAEGGKLYAEALALKKLCDKYNVPLIIDDRLDIAIAVHAAGVHIGQDDIPCKIARQVLEMILSLVYLLIIRRKHNKPLMTVLTI